MTHTIDVVIDENGSIQATVNGLPGPACGDVTRWIEALGEVVEDVKTPEYYRRQMVGTQARAGR